MARKYEKLAEEIIKNVGGKENVISLECCITRLRFRLKDEDIADADKLKSLKKVIAVVQNGGQYQVVIGTDVEEVFKEILEYQGVQTVDGTPVGGKPTRPLDMFVDTVSGIFTPVLGVLAASGMLKGLLSLFVALEILQTDSGTYKILNVVSDAFFYFMPIFLAYSAAKKFKMDNEFTAMAIGAALVHPNLATIRGGEIIYNVFEGTIFSSPVQIEFLGLPVILMNYASTVIPIILAVWFAAKVEKFFARRMPAVFKSFGVSFCTMLVSIPLTLLVVGPVATWLGQTMSAVVVTTFNVSPMVAGVFLGALWQIFVMFGIHWSFVPVMLNNFATLGNDPVMVVIFAASFAQIGVVLAILLRTENRKLKGIALPAFITGIFGITEPAIYGVTLPRQKYFLISCIGAAIGGAFIAFFEIKVYVFGAMGIFELPTFINPATNDMSGMYYGILSALIAFGIGFALTYPIYRDEGEDKVGKTFQEK